MRKIISCLLTIAFLAIPTSNIMACKIADGTEIKVNLNNSPTKQVSNEDPLKNYVFNDNYIFQKENGIYTALAAYQQLAADKIKIDENTLKTPGIATDFYNSEGYKSGHYDAFDYNNWSTGNNLNHPFTFADKNGAPIVGQLIDDDITKLQFIYWFVTFNSAVEANTPPVNKDAVTSIVAPTMDEFTNDDQQIIRQGWIHLDLTMGKFRIDFNIRIDFIFALYSNKNHQKIVRMAPNTILYSLGQVDFYHPERTFDDYNGRAGRISNMIFSKI